jgi:hypothetical protein
MGSCRLGPTRQLDIFERPGATRVCQRLLLVWQNEAGIVLHGEQRRGRHCQGKFSGYCCHVGESFEPQTVVAVVVAGAVVMAEGELS